MSQTTVYNKTKRFRESGEISAKGNNLIPFDECSWSPNTQTTLNHFVNDISKWALEHFQTPQSENTVHSAI